MVAQVIFMGAGASCYMRMKVGKQSMSSFHLTEPLDCGGTTLTGSASAASVAPPWPPAASWRRMNNTV
jgi:hypothetical protein